MKLTDQQYAKLLQEIGELKDVEPESEYLKIRALWQRFLDSAPPMDENYKFTEDFSSEHLATIAELGRENVGHVGYLVYYVERLLKEMGVELD